MPILKGTELGKIIFPCPIHEGILKNPANGCLIPRQLDIDSLREAGKNIA
jgi:hypothetical protein